MLIALGLGIYKISRVIYCNQKVILLSFDDYGAPCWEAAFDRFEKYDARVTFFINAREPTDFCFKAIAPPETFRNIFNVNFNYL